MTRVVVISGSRKIEHRPAAEYEDLFAEFVNPFLDNGSQVVVGGAVGIDSLALTWLVRRTTVGVLVVVPGHVDGQPAEAQQAIVEARQQPRVQIVELAHPEFSSTAAYHARNRWMIDRASFLVAFPLGDDPKSGTWYTVGYAAQRQLPRLIVPI